MTLSVIAIILSVVNLLALLGVGILMLKGIPKIYNPLDDEKLKNALNDLNEKIEFESEMVRSEVQETVDIIQEKLLKLDIVEESEDFISFIQKTISNIIQWSPFGGKRRIL